MRTNSSGRLSPRHYRQWYRTRVSERAVSRVMDAAVRLTPTEWGMVEVLVHYAGTLVSQRQIVREVWGSDHVSDTSYLRVAHGAHPPEARTGLSRPRHS